MGAVINHSRWEGMHPFCFIQKVSLYLLSLQSRRGQGIELRRAEKFAQCDAEAIAQSLDSHRAGILALTEKDAFDGGLRHVGYFAQFVGRDALFPAKLTDSVCYGFLSVHDVPPLSVDMHIIHKS